MYHIRPVVPNEDIILPQCMYYLKNPNNNLKIDQSDINVTDQVKRFLKGSPNNTMIELEHRQNQLLQKLDALYERVKGISKLCMVNVPTKTVSTVPSASVRDKLLTHGKEIVIVLNPEIGTQFINIFLQSHHNSNVTWHIHSSVPNKVSQQIKEYFQSKQDLCLSLINSEINIRLIFKCVSASAELRLSSLDVPIVGVVNVLRYLCYLYPNIVPFKQNDFCIDSLLDQCHLLERISAGQQGEIIGKLFSHCRNWIYEDAFSIVDLAAYIIIKWKNITKSVPKSWASKCEKMLDIN